MKRVVGIIGSPRKTGNTATVVGEVLRGAKESGAEVTMHHLNSMNIRGCQSCMYCRTHPSCSLNDDMGVIYESIKRADVVVVGSPIYIYQVSGQAKIMMDRFYPLTDEKHKPRFGKKKLIMVYTQAAPFSFIFRKYIRYMRKVFKSMGLIHYKDIIATKCFKPDSSKKNEKILKKAYNIGKSI